MVKLVILLSILSLFSCDNNKGKPIATIDKLGITITQENVDSYVSKMPAKDRKKYSSIEGKNIILHEMIRNNIFNAELEKEGLKNEASFQQEYNSSMKYKIAGLYSHWKKTNVGYDENELKMFYDKNKSKFMGKDSTISDFADVKDEVVLEYILENENLKSLYDKIIVKYTSKPSINIKHIYSSKDNLLDAYGELKSGVSFAEVAKKFSEDETTKNSGGVLGSYYKDQSFFGIKDSLTSLFNSLNSMSIGTYSSVVKSEKGYHIFYLTSKREAVVKSFDDVKSDVAKEFYKSRQDSLNKITSKDFESKYVSYRFDSVKVDFSQVSKFYNDNKQMFSEKLVKLVDISSKSSKLIASIEQKLKAGIPFEELYNDSSNDKILSDEFYLPTKIKYPEIKREVLNLTLNTYSDMFRTDYGYHVIKLVAVGKDSIPEFDSSRVDIQASYYKNLAETKPSTKLLTVGDISYTFENYINAVHNRVNDEKQFLAVFSKENIDNFLKSEIRTLIGYLEAKNSGYLDRSDVKEMVSQLEVSFWGYMYEREVISKYSGYSRTEVNKLINKNSAFSPSEDEIKSVILKNYIKDSDLYSIYEENIDQFVDTNGKLLDFSMVKPQILQNYQNSILRKKKIETYKNFFKQYKVVFNDESMIPRLLVGDVYTVTMPEKESDSLWSAGEKYLESNDVNSAQKIYSRLIDDSKYGYDAYTKLARLYEGEKKLGKSLEIYNKLLLIKNSKRDETLFLKGFLYYENLKRPDLAKPYFEELLKDYPKSELADDASVLVKGELPDFAK